MKPRELYLNPQPFPYCKGCSHRLVDLAVAQAFGQLDLDPLDVVLVSDIGCVGLVDRYFRTHTVHTLHGRSTAVAAGMRWVTPERPPYFVVMIGDGGATIGLLHLIEAAKLDLDLTIVLHNNFLYGMTGGQHSGLTPEGFRTRTTPDGNPAPPLPILDLLIRSGATYAARALAQDRMLPDLLAQAIQHPGFAIVEVIELCTAYAVPMNALSGKKLRAWLDEQGLSLGVLHQVNPRRSVSRETKKSGLPPLQPIEPRYAHRIMWPFSIFVAGTAGEGVQSAARWFTLAMNLAGLQTTQKNDNPVTVGTGYSTSELQVSPNPIDFTGVVEPNFAVVTSEDGLKRFLRRLPHWKRAPRLVVIEESLNAEPCNGVEIWIPWPLRKHGSRTLPTILGLLIGFYRSGFWVDPEAFRAAGQQTRYPNLVEKAFSLVKEAGIILS